MTALASRRAADRRAVAAGPWAGTGALLRLAARRDRVVLPATVLGFAAMVAFSAVATKDLYPSAASLREAAETINATAALVALYGKIYDPASLGAVSLVKMTAFGAALVAVAFVFLVVRHTRREEESGRLELVAAGVVGRRAPLTAALLLTVAGSLALGVCTTFGLVLGGLPWAGSLAFGLGWALTGVVFGAVAGVVAQVTTSGRAAVGLGMMVVGVAYALRAVGDLAAADPGILSWLSPIGWSQQVRPYAGDRFLVLLLPLAATAVLVPTAYALRARRDLGAGFVPERLGPSTGRLGSGLALAWRLQRGMLLAWLVATALLGLVLGAVANDVAGLFDSPEMLRFLAALGGEQGLTDMFLAAEVGLLGALVAAYGVAAALRLRSEEEAGHAELLLSRPLARLRWAAGHVVVAVAGTAAVILATGGAIGLAHGLAVDDVGGQTARLVGASAAQVPAAWVVVAVTVLLFGWMPRWAHAAWAYLVGCIVLGEFGALWELPGWVLGLSPFDHSPTVPGGTVDWLALVALLAVAGLVTAIGLVGWQRRDLRP